MPFLCHNIILLGKSVVFVPSPQLLPYYFCSTLNYLFIAGQRITASGTSRRGLPSVYPQQGKGTHTQTLTEWNNQ